MKIEKVEISNLEAALRGMRNPMNSWEKSTPSADIELGRKLSAAGPTHGKFLRMITVTCDITAPLYWWKEFDTYKVGTVANSCSTMHTLMDKEFTMEDFEVSADLIIYGTYYEKIISMLNDLRESYMICKQRGYTTDMRIYWEAIVSMLPSGYLQKRTVMLNYEVVRRIVKDRTGHKLKEWHVFINTMEQKLPFYSQFILGEALNKKIDNDEGEEEHMETRETAQNKEEAKADSGKPKLSLVPRQIIFDIAKVREFGTKKYGDSENWKCIEVQRYRDAAFRHFMAYLDDPYGVDGESGLSHLSHLACNISFLCEMEHTDEIATVHNKEALRKVEADIENAKRYINTEKATDDIIADTVKKCLEDDIMALRKEVKTVHDLLHRVSLCEDDIMALRKEVKTVHDLLHRVSLCEYDITALQGCIKELRDDSTDDADLQNSINTLELAVQGCKNRLAEIWSDK